MEKVDAIIIGAGAAGLMCGIEAGKRGRRVIILDHANKPGKKILMSGGGRCNFTNTNIIPVDYISHNSHFCKSALTRYTQWDFIDLVKKHHIPFHGKTLGQLFCDKKSKDILDMLLLECNQVGTSIRLNTTVTNITKMNDRHFKIRTTRGDLHTQSLVIATGGLSIPTMGASPFGYQIAEQFDLKVWPTRAGLVPLTLQPSLKESLSSLSGVSVDSSVNNKDISFQENILFTHRGLSGPAILQISSYWQAGEEISINLLPTINLFSYLQTLQKMHPLKQLNTVMTELLPKRVIDVFIPLDLANKQLANISHNDFKKVSQQFNAWLIKPNGTEGYRTAEVTLGGVDTNALSSKTMEVIHVPGLYFIGEVVDVTGWLGGYNFQWAWSSGWAAGQVI
ncbi:MAG: NAD(P)/FAD-dependent oxidoreductase [Gammaproteobacteria bacterium]|nr:NAD(P)/FAD-dependent oxidoreductase [Gammaproteobacteria bacterium]